MRACVDVFSLRVIRRLVTLLRTAPASRRVVLFALFGALAFVTGFIAIPPTLAERLIVGGGYYYMLGLFSLCVYCGWRVAARRRVVWFGWLRRPGWVGLVLAAATVFAIWADPFKHKILYDEYVLQGTAWHMHATKEIGTPIRAYDFSGTWLAIDTFLDKRPYFFAFLLSLLHDLSGFRVANVFALNATFAPVCLALVYWFARQLTGRREPAFLAVGLVATLPLFGQNVSGAGMELHNLVMIAFAMAAALLYLRAPDDDRLSLFVVGVVLLAQSRYESALFVVPAAWVIVAGWLRIGRVLLPWPALVAPLLLVPYAWQNSVVSAKPILWQLREGETTRFGLRYFAGNLAGARKFFFGTSPEYSNSWWLTAVGTAALVWGIICVCVCVWRRVRRSGGTSRPLASETVVLLAFGAAIAANLVLEMFYYWGRLDEPIASRLALPAYFLCALLAAWLVHDLDARHLPATRFAALGLVVWLLVWGAPAYARRLYTTQNLLMRELEWDSEQIGAHPGPLLLVTNKATIPFLLDHIPVVNIAIGRTRGPAIAWHLREGTFHEVLVSQALRPTSAAGDLGVDPEDVLPETFHLQTLAVERFGLRWDRISRLDSIDPEPDKPEVGTDHEPKRAEPATPVQPVP
jgi:hypothetical protein